MNTLYVILSWLVPLMLGWGMLSVLYWRVARPVLHDAVLFRIFRKRDSLRALAVDGEVDPNSFAYGFLERRLCQTAYASPGITIVNFIRFCLSDDANEPFPELDRFCEEAPDKLKELWISAADEILLMMLANSPVLAAAGALAVQVDRVRRTVSNSVKRFFEREVIVDVSEPELAPA